MTQAAENLPSKHKQAMSSNFNTFTKRKKEDDSKHLLEK
jgi:hypothetical protein